MRVFKIRTESFDYYFREELTEPGSAGEALAKFVGNDAKELWGDTPDGLSLVELFHARKGKPRREIYALDMVFAAPKSLSVQWAIETETRAQQIVQAHTQAVAAAVTYLEMVDLCRRVSNQVLGSTGVAGARFTHFTSRNADPHLHSHVVIGNASTFEDLGPAALDVGRLTRIGPALEVVYRAELTRGLKDLLGLDLVGPQLGTLFINGQPPEYVSFFSSRRQEVMAAAGERASARKRQIATLLTRKEKSIQDLNSLRQYWKRSLEDISLGPAPRIRPREVLVGEELLRGGGIYLSPVPDPFHSEICFQALLEPNLALEQRLVAAAEVFKISPCPSQIIPQGRDRYCGRLSATTQDFNYVGLSIKERTSELDPFSPPFGRFLLPRSDAERRLFQSLGLLGDSTDHVVRRSALEMGSLSRLAPSQITELIERGLVVEVRENRTIASVMLDFRDELVVREGELLRIEIDSDKVLRVFGATSEIHAMALAHFEDTTAANCQGAPLSSHFPVLEVGSAAVKDSILSAARSADAGSLIRLGRSWVLPGEALSVYLSSGFRSGILSSPGDSPDVVRFSDVELGEIELPMSRIRWATNISIAVCEPKFAPGGVERATPRGGVTLYAKGGGVDVLIPKAHILSMFDRYSGRDLGEVRCISEATLASLTGDIESAWRARIHDSADTGYDRSRLRQMSEQVSLHKALLEVAETYFPRIDDDWEAHRRRLRPGHEMSGMDKNLRPRERAGSFALPPR